ncbi:MAG: hypothetical protein GX129_00060, partial [Clostridiales bacterium]|nr:hypothetical protein [Clostridiales bacterium]
MSRSKRILLITVVIMLVMLGVGFINYVLDSKRFEDNPSNLNNEDITDSGDEFDIEADKNENLDSSNDNTDDDIIENNNTDNKDNSDDSNTNTDNNDNKDNKLNNNSQNDWVKVSIYDAKPEDLTEMALLEPMTLGLVDYPLVASIPEEDIYLFGADDGVILRHGELLKPFEWVYLMPRFVLPRLKLKDIDEDGIEEIICILYVASGTGLAIEELHILEPDEDEIYRDVFFTPDDYDRQLHELITFEYDEENNRLYYIAGEMDYEFDAPEVFTEYTYSGNIGFGMIKLFEFDDGITFEDHMNY